MLHTHGRRVIQGDGGTAGLLTLGAGLIACGVALAVVLGMTGVGVAAVRARIAADAAALAAMGASPLAGGTGSPDDEAARVAAANGARVVAVDRGQWPLRVVVDVVVEPRALLAGVPAPPMRARAAAAVRPRSGSRGPPQAALSASPSEGGRGSTSHERAAELRSNPYRL